MARLPRPLLRPRWIVAGILVVATAALFVRLGFWQLDRLDERRALNGRIDAGLSAPAAPLSEVGNGTAAFRRVSAEGTYVPDGEVILFGRTLDGRPGNHVLTPFADEAGTIVLVDRGWVPIELDRPGDARVATPPGPVRVAGILVPGEEGAPPDPNGTVGAIDVGAIAGSEPDAAARPTRTDVYLRLQTQEPPPDDLPRPVPLPPRSDGPHLSYAVQWFLFATIAVVGFVVLLRKVAGEHRRGDDRARRVDNL